MCTKGIPRMNVARYPQSISSMHRPSIDNWSTLHWHPCWHSIDTPLTSQLTVGLESTNDQFMQVAEHPTDFCIHKTKCWLRVKRVLTEYWSGCRSSIMYWSRCWSRVSIKYWLTLDCGWLSYTWPSKYNSLVLLFL